MHKSILANFNSTPYSVEQQKFIDVFSSRTKKVLNDIFSDHLNGDGLLDRIEAVVSSVDDLEAGFNLLKVLSKVSTVTRRVVDHTVGEIPLEAINLTVEAVQTGIKFVKRVRAAVDKPFAQEESYEGEYSLILEACLDEVGNWIAALFGEFLTEKISKKDIPHFARLTHACVMDKVSELCYESADPDELFNAKAILYYLLNDVTSPMFSMNFRIHVNGERFFNLFSVKSVWTRSPVITYTQTANTEQSLAYTIYRSAHESRFFCTTQHKKTGHIALPETVFQEKQEMAKSKNLLSIFPARTIALKEHRTTDEKINLLKSVITIYYEVSRILLTEYLQSKEIRTWIEAGKDEDTSRLTLRGYLCQRLGVNVIPECHNEEWSELDLEGGDFSYGNYRRIILINNKMESTRWFSSKMQRAHVGNYPRIIFEEPDAAMKERIVKFKEIVFCRIRAYTASLSDMDSNVSVNLYDIYQQQDESGESNYDNQAIVSPKTETVELLYVAYCNRDGEYQYVLVHDRAINQLLRRYQESSIITHDINIKSIKTFVTRDDLKALDHCIKELDSDAMINEASLHKVNLQSIKGALSFWHKKNFEKSTNISESDYRGSFFTSCVFNGAMRQINADLKLAQIVDMMTGPDSTEDEQSWYEISAKARFKSIEERLSVVEEELRQSKKITQAMQEEFNAFKQFVMERIGEQNSPKALTSPSHRLFRMTSSVNANDKPTSVKSRMPPSYKKLQDSMRFEQDLLRDTTTTSVSLAGK